ncbi:MAG: hypothetical protein GY832_28000 [Chloroflexi bacterium]|nr:hypothetical protein [Chloroflexota bacterium]
MKFLSKSIHNLLSSRPSLRQWGQGLVEFALVLPVFLVTIFVLVEGAFIIQGYLTVQHAAREAARWAVTYRPAQGAKIDETDCDGSSAGDNLAYYVDDAVDAGNTCFIGEDEDEYNARRVALIEKVALQRAAGLRIDWAARGLTEDDFNSHQNTPGFFGVRVVGSTWDGVEDYHTGAPGLPITVTVVHRVELVDPILGAIAPDGVRVQASANMVNEGVLVVPPDSGSGTPQPTVAINPTPEDTTPVPSATPTLPPQADYCLQISFDHVTNTLPFDRGHDVGVLVTNCATGDPWPDSLPVSFSTTEGAFDYSGAENPDDQYAEAMTDVSGVAVRTVYANEPGMAELRVWVDLDGGDDWDSGERFDLAYKTWVVPEDGPYILASSYEVLPEDVITVDVFKHPEVSELFTLLWCQVDGAGIASSVLTTSIDVDTDEKALDLPVMIPADSAGVYQLETHTEPAGDCGSGSQVAYSAEIRIKNLPPDLRIVSISYPAMYGDVFPAGVEVLLRIEVENLLPWPVEDTAFDIDLYVNPPVTPTLGQIGNSKQWLANIAGYGTEIVTITQRIDEFGTINLWAQVDTTNYVDESDETNNIFGPYPVEVDCTIFSSEYGDDFDDGSFDGKWSTAEMGSNVGGSVTEDGGGYLQIHGRGGSIWSTSDNFFYVYQSISGNFDVRVRVISPPSNSGAKVGVMVRNSTAANGRHVMATARDSDGRRLQFAYRETDGDGTNYVGSGEINTTSPPVWLRIVRDDNDFAFYYSHDETPGDNWTLWNSGAAVEMDEAVQIGIAHAKYSSSGSPYTSQVDEFVVCRPLDVPPIQTPPGMKECTQHFEAQDFEGNLGSVFPPWSGGDTPSAWQRNGYFPRGGAFSVHLHASLGELFPCENSSNNPWIAQTVQVPSTASTMTQITVEGFRAVGGSRATCSQSGTTDADDALYVELLDGSGNPLVGLPQPPDVAYRKSALMCAAQPSGRSGSGELVASKGRNLTGRKPSGYEGSGSGLVISDVPPVEERSPLAATTVYNFAGVTQATCIANGICAHESDVDRFPYRSSGHQNTFVEASNGEYSAIGVDDTNYWQTVDPGDNDEIFAQFDMVINESIADISQIDFTFKGYTFGGDTQHRIYALRTGQDPFLEASWVEVTRRTLNSGDREMTGSLTTNLADYIDPGTGAIVWGVNNRRSSRAMRLYYAEMAVTYDNPPNAPIDLLCEGLVNPVDVVDTLPEFSWTFSDPDVGDTQGAYQIQVGTDADWGNGAEMWDPGWVTDPASLVEYNAAELALDGTTYYWRVQTQESSGATGAWSATQQFTMKMNNPPDAPINLLTEALVNPVDVDDTLPEFSWTFSDPDVGDTQGAYQIQVGTDADWGNGAEMWDSSWVTGTASLAEYGAAELRLDGTTYYWRVRTQDSYGFVGPWSVDTQEFTMLFEPNNPPDVPIDLLCEDQVNPVDVTDTRPEFSWTFSDPDAGDVQSAYQIQVGTDVDWGNGAEMWDSNWVGDAASLAEYGAAAISPDGTTYYWRVRTQDADGADGSWSATQQFTMVARPAGFIVDGGAITNTWQHFSVDFAGIDLVPLAGQNVMVRFYGVHDGDKYGTYFYLDDLALNICTEWPIPDLESDMASFGGKVRAVIGNVYQDMVGVTVVAYSAGGQVYQTNSIHDATYHFYNVPPGTYTVYAQTWVDNKLLIDSATVTVVSDDHDNHYVDLLLQ